MADATRVISCAVERNRRRVLVRLGRLRTSGVRLREFLRGRPCDVSGLQPRSGARLRGLDRHTALVQTA